MRSGDPLGRAKALYDRRVTPERTREMRGLLVDSAAETAAYTATTVLCEYLNRWNDATKEHMDRAEAAIRYALDNDPDFFLAHYAQGFLHRARGDHAAAVEAFDRTIKANPDFARAYAQRGEDLVYLGRPDEGIKSVERALELSPTSAVRGYFLWVIGRAQFFLKRDEEAIPRLRQSVREWSSVWYNRLYLVSVLTHSDQVTTAKRSLAAFDIVFPGYTLARVIENEGATPADHEFVVAGRERFHEGLLKAGMRRDAGEAKAE